MRTQEAERLREELEQFVDGLSSGMRHRVQRERTREYVVGLLLEGDRKSMEPMAARLAPDGVEAKRQALQHFVTHSPWRDDCIRSALARRFDGDMEEAVWIVDDTGFPKQGKHSVGVKRQYSGTLGKIGNCQVASSIHLANDEASVSLDWDLYLPKEWAEDPKRRAETKIPGEVTFRPKWKIALEQIDRIRSWRLIDREVLADSAYGNNTGFRDGLRVRQLQYTVQIEGRSAFWTPGQDPQPPRRLSGPGRPRTCWDSGQSRPRSAKQIAASLPRGAFRQVTWRDGTQGRMRSRFARVRVRPAPAKQRSRPLRPEEWLIVEWPTGESAPTKYWLSTAPASISLRKLVRRAKLRWRIERDYQDLKGEVGLDHFEGRTYPGWHHHVTLTMVAHAFLVNIQLNKKNSSTKLDVATCVSRTATHLGALPGTMLAMPTEYVSLPS